MWFGGRFGQGEHRHSVVEKVGFHYPDNTARTEP
jgi:hypothetical protein